MSLFDRDYKGKMESTGKNVALIYIIIYGSVALLVCVAWLFTQLSSNSSVDSYESTSGKPKCTTIYKYGVEHEICEEINPQLDSEIEYAEEMELQRQEEWKYERQSEEIDERDY